jgi:hypothetical protein
MLFGSGVCQNNDRNDLWSYNLITHVWTQLAAENTLTQPTYNLMVYVPVYDLYVMFGMHGNGNGQTYVYCPSASLSGNQTTAGCSSPQTLSSTVGPGLGGTLPTYNRNWNNAMFWDPVINKVILFSKDEDSGAREVLLYDVLAKTWTVRNTIGTPTDAASLSTGDKDTVRITSGPFAGKYLFLLTTRTLACNGASAAYIYDPVADSYTAITLNGGPKCAVHLAWDSSVNRLFSWSGASSDPVIHTGVIQ